MAKDTLALNLKGEVTLDLYAKALRYFSQLVDTLTEEVLGYDGNLQWEVSDLEAGSARLVVRPIQADSQPVERVVDAFVDIGRALERGQVIPFSDDVARYAIGVTSVINGYISEVDFVTDTYTATIKERVKRPALNPLSISEVIGTVEVLSRSERRRQPYRPQMLIRDSAYGNIVRCDLWTPEQTEVARDAWMKRVSVTGLMYRHPETGKPLHVKRIYDMQILPAVDAAFFDRVAGALPWIEGDEPAEVTIGRLRDASEQP